MVWKGMAWDKNRGGRLTNQDRSGWGGLRPGDKVRYSHVQGTISSLDPDRLHVSVKDTRSRRTYRVHHSFLELLS